MRKIFQIMFCSVAMMVIVVGCRPETDGQDLKRSFETAIERMSGVLDSRSGSFERALERLNRQMASEHAMLIVVISNSEPDKDKQLIKNALSVGGTLVLGSDSDYADFLREVDPLFERAAAVNSASQFKILPCILNWVCKNGWKFQQKFCINLNNENAEYIFVK